MAQPPQQQDDRPRIMVRPVEAGADWQEYRRSRKGGEAAIRCPGLRAVMDERRRRQQEEGGA